MPGREFESRLMKPTITARRELRNKMTADRYAARAIGLMRQGRSCYFAEVPMMLAVKGTGVAGGMVFMLPLPTMLNALRPNLQL